MAVGKVKLAGFVVDEQISKIAEGSHEFAEAERRKRFDSKPDWIRLKELRAKLERRQKAEATEVTKAIECEDEAKEAVKRAQGHRQRAAQIKQQVQSLEEELHELVVAAPTGDDGTGGGGVAASSSSGAWLPSKLRRIDPSQQCDQWRSHLQALAAAQAALEQMHKEEESRAREAKAAKQAKDGLAAQGDGAGTADADGDAAMGDNGTGPQAAPRAAEVPVPTDEELDDLVAKLAEAFAGGADKEDAEEAKKRAAAVLHDSFRAIKRTKLG